MARASLYGLAWRALVFVLTVSAPAWAQTPDPIYRQLLKIGQIPDLGCTAKLYRPMMPANDYDTWWPPGAASPDPAKAGLYPGITIDRNERFGPDAKDVLDIFSKEGGRGRRPVFIFVPGGGGNKIEQSVREANAFYDNIGRWGVKNGFVVVVMQRHAGVRWDDGGRDIAAAVDWLKANVARYQGDGGRMVMAAHSGGNRPAEVYVGHPERWSNGVQIKALIHLSRNPPSAPANGPQPGESCGLPPGPATNTGDAGRISGPGSVESSAAVQPRTGAVPPLPPEERAERDNLPGYKVTKVRLMLVRAELDVGVKGEMTPDDRVFHDVLCATEGLGAKDGEGRCPAMLYARRHSHMSEVMAFDTPDKSVSQPILDFIRTALAELPAH